MFCTASVLFSCKTQPSLPPGKKTAQTSQPQDSVFKQKVVAIDSTQYDSLLTVLLNRENTIYLAPKDKNNIVPFTSVSFDSASGCFLVAGKGTQNREFPESAWEKARKMASAYEAKRWALYAKAWTTGSSMPFGQKITGEITYSNVLRERLENDTLYVLVSVPIGSVVLK
jgi:hypothetical protein